MRLDKNGDSEGNFSVLALTYPKNTNVIDNFSCEYQMRPVGQFRQAQYNYTMIEHAFGNDTDDEFAFHAMHEVQLPVSLNIFFQSLF